MNTMNKVLKILDAIEKFIMISFLAFMVAASFAIVVTRYFFHYTPSWTEQLTRIMFVWITMFGISIAGGQGRHMRVTALADVMPPKVRKAMYFLGDFLMMLFGFYMSYKILTLCIHQVQRPQYFSAIPWLPMWVMYVAGVLGMLSLGIRSLLFRVIPYFKMEGIPGDIAAEETKEEEVIS